MLPKQGFLNTAAPLYADLVLVLEIAMVSTYAVGSGVIISTYRPNGPLRTSSYGDARE